MIAPTGFFADYGCHVRILEEAQALQAQGHAVTIFTYPSGATPEGLRVVRLPAPGRQARARVGSHRRKLLLDPLLGRNGAGARSSTTHRRGARALA